MPASSIALAESYIKKYYMPPILKQLDEKPGPVWAALQKTVESVPGNEFFITLEYGRHGGLGARPETGDVPAASERLHKQGKTSVKNIYGRIAMTEKLLIASKDNRMAFASELTRQMENITTDATDYVARNFMTSHDGVFGYVQSVAAGTPTVITLNPDNSIINAFYPGQVIDTITGTTVTDSARMVVDVDYVTGKVSVNGTITAAAGAKIAISDAYSYEMTGLQDILTANNILYGIDRAQNKWFNPNVQDKASGGTPTPLDGMWLETAADEIAIRSGEKPTFYVCSHGVERAYKSWNLQFGRNNDMQTLKGGYKLVSHNGIPLSPEKYFPRNQMAMISMPWMRLGMLRDWGWMSETGSMFTKVPNKAEYEATLTLYGDLLCKFPSSNSLIKGIEEVA
ncbi:MAG: phage major capsid protein [Clostridiales Family XIII bacterium]|jgi:hypothetical protein|nr:phage major capsid protein [Clostridiales Family XIII bacterium]